MQVLEEIHGQTIGTVTQLMLFEPGPQGEMAFQVGGKPVQYPRLGAGCAGLTVPAIVQPRYTALYHPQSNALLGVFFDNGDEDLTVLCGPRWGDVIDWQGEEFTAANPFALVRSMHTSINVNEQTPHLAIRFPLNVHALEHFQPWLRKSLRHVEHFNYIEIFSDPLSGKFLHAQLEVIHRDSQMLLDSEDFAEFPLDWKLDKQREYKKQAAEYAAQDAEQRAHDREQRLRAAEQRMREREERMRTAEQSRRDSVRDRDRDRQDRKSAPDERESTTGNRGPRRPQRPQRPQSPFSSQSSQSPLRPDNGSSPARHALQPKAPRKPPPPTAHLAVEELLKIIAGETDPNSRWRMLEENLNLKKQERTYQLIAAQGDLIAENVTRWNAQRLVSTFAPQAAAVLEAIARYLSVDKILALAEQSIQKDEMLQWLRERELERLLRSPVEGVVQSKAEARQLLNVSPDCEDAEVRKVWRRLLGFINADYGRGQEKAIHQKKDQIAKRLQQARDVLAK